MSLGYALYYIIIKSSHTNIEFIMNVNRYFMTHIIIERKHWYLGGAIVEICEQILISEMSFNKVCSYSR